MASPRVPDLRVPGPKVPGLRSQGHGFRVPNFEAQVSGLRSYGPKSEILILDYAILAASKIRAKCLPFVNRLRI